MTGPEKLKLSPHLIADYAAVMNKHGIWRLFLQDVTIEMRQDRAPLAPEATDAEPPEDPLVAKERAEQLLFHSAEG